MLLVEIQAQTIYQMKSQCQLRKKIKFLDPNKEKRTPAKSPTRSHSKTNYTQNKQAKQQTKEVEELKKEIAQLKQNQNDELRHKETRTNDHQNDHSKNLQEASNNIGQKQSNIKTEVTEVINLNIIISNSTNNGNFTKLQRTTKTSLKQRHKPDGCVINFIETFLF